MKNIRIVVLELVGPLLQKFRSLLLPIRGYKNIHPSVIIESGVRLDKVYPAEIYIGAGTLIASHTTILTHEHVYREPYDLKLPLKKSVRIGERCFIGVSTIILPGVSIGNSCIIGAGSIVAHDIPSGSLAVGVPARIVRTNINLNQHAIANQIS